MFADGLIEELRGLRDAGYGPEAKAMEAVGYRQAHAFLNQQLSIEQAIAETSTRTADDLVPARRRGGVAGGLWGRFIRSRPS